MSSIKKKLEQLQKSEKKNKINIENFKEEECMERYDYRQAIMEDIQDYINEEIVLAEYSDREELEEHLNEVLWNNDSVTGNASGSYFCNAWKAEECICHNLDLLGEALAEFCCDSDILSRGAESCDVTIRCYLLYECVSAVLDEIENSYTFSESDDC